MARFSLGGKRYDTSKMVDLGISTPEQGGVTIEGVYMMPRSRRVIVQTYSRWDRGDGSHVGSRYHWAARDEIERLAQEHDCDQLRELLPPAAGDREILAVYWQERGGRGHLVTKFRGQEISLPWEEPIDAGSDSDAIGQAIGAALPAGWALVEDTPTEHDSACVTVTVEAVL